MCLQRGQDLQRACNEGRAFNVPTAKAGLATCLQRRQGFQRYNSRGSNQSPVKEIWSNIRVQDVYCNELYLLYEYFKSRGKEEKNKGQTHTAHLIRILLGLYSWSGDWWVLGAGPALPRARARARAGAGAGVWPRPPRPLYWASACYKLRQ